MVFIEKKEWGMSTSTRGGDMPYGYVYEIRNNVNGKSYIGSRKLALDTSWEQYMGSGVLIKKAIRKYGRENFTKFLVCYAMTVDDLYAMEWEHIKKSQDNGTGGEYNLFRGPGAGGDTFSLLVGEDKEKALRRQAEGVRSYYQERGYRENERRISERDENLINEKGDLIKRVYSETGNLRKTAEIVGTTMYRIRRVSDDLGLELNHQNVHGRIMPRDTAQKISEARKRYEETKSPVDKRNEKTCVSCEKKFFPEYQRRKFCSHECRASSQKHHYQQNDPNYDELYKMWIIDDLSVLQMKKIIGVSQRKVYYLLERNGLPTRKREAQKLREEHHSSTQIS